MDYESEEWFQELEKKMKTIFEALVMIHGPEGLYMGVIPDPVLCINFFGAGHTNQIFATSVWDKDFFDWAANCFEDLFERGQDIMNVTADIWIKERRLRPVYELLDSGNNKKVITEVDKLLKKQPNFPCAKVLKALALIRLNKNEEAEAILGPVNAETPTDDGTIQALSICYRELDQPEVLCAFLEAACKKEQTEELLTHCFMAQVRVNEFQKQHHTAMQLYKMTNKPNYFFWAIASLLVKYEQGAKEGKMETISLLLAERMIEKYIVDHKQTMNDDTLTKLFLSALEKLNKPEKILQVLAKSGYPDCSWNNNDNHRLYCNALSSLEKWEELFAYFKKTFYKNPSEYAVLSQMTQTFGKSHPEWVVEFLDELLKSQPSRVVALADMEFTFGLIATDQDCEDENDVQARIEKDLALVILYGGDKPSFSSDLAEYFPYFRRFELHYYFGLLDVVNYNTMNNIISDVNYEILLRHSKPDDSPLACMRRANRCFGKYLACEAGAKKLRSDNNMRTKESDYYDQFIVIAASALLSENLHSKTAPEVVDYPTEILAQKDVWSSMENLNSEVCSIFKNLYKDDPQDENVPVKEFSGKYMEDKRLEYLLLIAGTLLKYGVDRSPHNHSLRILLSRLYSRLGAHQMAVKMIQALDLKHIQWETLGYLVFHESVSGAVYTEGYRLLCLAENMYITFKKESMEYLTTCYKYGSFPKIDEFLGFRDQIKCSFQHRMVLVERRLLEILIHATSPADLKKACEGALKELDFDSPLTGPYGDNRDFTVLEAFTEDEFLSKLKTSTSDVGIFHMRMRYSLLALMSKLVVYAPDFEPNEEKGDLIAHLYCLERFISSWDQAFASLCLQFDQSSLPYEHLFHGMWPPGFARHFKMGSWKWIESMVKCVMTMASTPKDDQDSEPPCLDDFTERLNSAYNQSLAFLHVQYPISEMDKMPLMKIEEVFQHVHFTLENFSIYRIFASVVLTLSKEKFDHWKPSGAGVGSKKKGRGKTSDQKRARQAIQNIALDKSTELGSYVTALQTSFCERTYEDFDSTQAMWKTLLKPSFLYHAFPLFYDSFVRDMKQSHEFQLKEMVKCSNGLIEFLRALQP